MHPTPARDYYEGLRAHANKELVRAHAEIAKLKEALREALKEGESLNKHFYRDGPWEWVKNIRKALEL